MSDHKDKKIVYEELPVPKEDIHLSLQLFCDNLDLILENANRIISTPKYFHIRHRWSYFGDTTMGSKNIQLGVLVLLWKEKKWISACKECNNETYMYRVGGVSLSGGHQYHAACPNCRKTFYYTGDSGLMALIKPVWIFMRNIINSGKYFAPRALYFPGAKA